MDQPIFGVSEVEGNSVIFINLEILKGKEDARISSRLSNANEDFLWNSNKYSIDNDNLWNTSVYFCLFWFWEEISTKTGIGALKH